MFKHRCEWNSLLLFLWFPLVGCTHPLETPNKPPAPITFNQAELDALAKCLPNGITLESRYSPTGRGERDATTVKNTLAGLGAYCKSGKIYDREGKEFFFFKLDSAAYTAPSAVAYDSPGFQIIRNQDRQKINELKDNYRVIEMYAPFTPQ